MIHERIAAGRVQRFHTRHMLQRSNVAQHSFNVMLILDYLYNGDPPPRVMRAAMFHDLHELYTGDIPHPFKHAVGGIGSHILAEERAIDAHMCTHVELTYDETEVLKAADMLECGLFVLEDARLGNRTCQDVMENVFYVLFKNTIPVGVVGKRFKELTGYIGVEWSKLQ